MIESASPEAVGHRERAVPHGQAALRGERERRLALVLTRRGAARVAADSVLDPTRLAAALTALGATERRALVAALERVADAGAALPATPPRRQRRARSTRSL